MKSGALYEISDPIEQIEERLIRLKVLKAMWDGIPAEHINLDITLQNKTTKEAIFPSNPTTACDTVACLAGWAWMYPDFIKAGLHKLVNYKHGPNILDAAEDFFGVDIWEASDGNFTYENETINHKKEASNRIFSAIAGTELELRWTKNYQSSMERM